MSISIFLPALEFTGSEYHRVLPVKRVSAPGDSYKDVILGCIH